jgi:hypothetical protein
MNVEFKAASRERLLKALTVADLQYTEAKNGTIEVRIGSAASAIVFDLQREKATLINNKDFTTLNKIKRTYSELTLEEVAKKKRWALRKQGENKFMMVR